MKYGILSDIHLEFRSTEFALKLLDQINNCDADKIIIAGDIGTRLLERNYFLEQIEKPVFYCLGNHDYYNSIVSDDFIETDELVGACLWTNFNNQDGVFMRAASRNINDFHAIKNQDGSLFTPSDALKLFQSQKERIFASKAKIVVTHFPITPMVIADKYKGDFFNGYFVNDLESEVLQSDKILWIAGHTHHRWDFMLGNTRMIGNCIGYPNEIKEKFEIKIVEV